MILVAESLMSGSRVHAEWCGRDQDSVVDKESEAELRGAAATLLRICGSSLWILK